MAMIERVTSPSFQAVITWGLIALVVYLLYQITKVFLVPLVWAAILTIFFFTVHRKILRYIRNGSGAALISVILVTALLVAPMIWLAPTFTMEAVAVVGQFRSEEVLPKAIIWMEKQLEILPISIGSVDEIIDEVGSQATTVVAAYSARFASNLVGFLLDLTVMLMAMFYLFRDGHKIVSMLKDISPLGGDYSERMRREVAELISVTLSSGFIVALVQGLLGGVIFWGLGMPSPLFWGVVIGFLAFLPVVGPWLVWIPASGGVFLDGDSGRAIILAVLGFLLISGADNILRPMLIAGRSQLNGLLVLVAVLGGIGVFGLIGFVVGPLVVATAVGMLRAYHQGLEERQKITLAKDAV